MQQLSDGGGPGVISQLLIVNEIMHQIKWALRLKEVPRPCDYAEMMVGSELGAYVLEALHRSHILTINLHLHCRVAVVLLARLRLTAEQALIHITELGQSVFLEPNESEVDPRFKQEALQRAIEDILQQYGLADTTKMIEDAVTSGETYA
jgi:hypothetical protein